MMTWGTRGKMRLVEKFSDPGHPEDIVFPFTFGLRQSEEDLIGDDFILFGRASPPGERHWTTR